MHLVGLIIKKFVTMHGHVNVYNSDLHCAGFCSEYQSGKWSKELVCQKLKFSNKVWVFHSFDDDDSGVLACYAEKQVIDSRRFDETYLQVQGSWNPCCSVPWPLKSILPIHLHRIGLVVADLSPRTGFDLGQSTLDLHRDKFFPSTTVFPVNTISIHSPITKDIKSEKLTVLK